MGSLGAAQSLGLAPLTSPGLWGPAMLAPHSCGVGIYISRSCRDREPPRLLVLILCPVQGEVGDPGAAGVRGLDGEQVQQTAGDCVPTLRGLLQPPPPQLPVPRVRKEQRRLLILKKASRLKLDQPAVLGLGFPFLCRDHQDHREQRVSWGPRVSRWVLGVMLGVVLGSPCSCRVTQAPESMAGV